MCIMYVLFILFCCKSLSPQPVGVQCPLTFSLGEFPFYWDWRWYPGVQPMLVSIAFSPSPSISRCFSIHSSSSIIGFHSCFFFTTDVGYLSAPVRSTLQLLAFK